MQKYIDLDSMEEWVKYPIQTFQNYSIIWKAIVKSFQLIGNWLVLKVGDEHRVHLGEDPWFDCRGSFELFEKLIVFLREKGLFTLSHVVDINSSSI